MTKTPTVKPSQRMAAIAKRAADNSAWATALHCAQMRRPEEYPPPPPTGGMVDALALWLGRWARA